VAGPGCVLRLACCTPACLQATVRSNDNLSAHFKLLVSLHTCKAQHSKMQMQQSMIKVGGGLSRARSGRQQMPASRC